MEKIIGIKDILLEILNYSIDICDWINFMVSAKNIYIQIYPEFIYKKFKFIVFLHQTLPPCSRNGNVKYYYYENDSHFYYPSYISTNEKHILGHHQFEDIYLMEICGIFFRELSLDKYGDVKINYSNLLKLIDNKDIFSNYYSIVNKSNINNYILPKLLLLTKKFIKTQKNEHDHYKIKNKFDHYRYEYNNYECETKNDTCIYCNETYIDDNTQFHKNWFVIDNWSRNQNYSWSRNQNYSESQNAGRVRISEYKTNSCYHPKCHEICKKIEIV